MPGAFGPAYGVSPPAVRFHVTQQLPTGPHPMTTDALVTSNNAISFASAVENTEREDKERIEDVSAQRLARMPACRRNHGYRAPLRALRAAEQQPGASVS
jgi:hypothetical protein